jgi:ankyrin repeat protein
MTTRTPQQQALDAALSRGVSNGDKDMMELALQKGAAPDLLVTDAYSRDNLGSIAPGLLTLALSKGADANLMLFCGIGKRELSVVKLAVEQGGADVNAVRPPPNASDNTPVAHWLYRCFNAEVSDYLVGKGMAVDTADKAGNTPLLLSVKADDLEKTSHYLSQGANPMLANLRGEFALKQLEDIQYSYGSQIYPERDALLKKMLKNVPGDAPDTASSPHAGEFNTVATKGDIEVSHPLELKKAPAETPGRKGFSL